MRSRQDVLCFFIRTPHSALRTSYDRFHTLRISRFQPTVVIRRRNVDDRCLAPLHLTPDFCLLTTALTSSPSPRTIPSQDSDDIGSVFLDEAFDGPFEDISLPSTTFSTKSLVVARAIGSGSAWSAALCRGSRSPGPRG